MLAGLEFILNPNQYFVAASDRFIKVDKGRSSFGLMRTDKLSKALLAFNSFLDAAEIFFVFDITFLYLIKSFFFGIKALKSLGLKEICKGIILLQKFEAHFQIIHLEFNQIVDENLVQIIWKTKFFVNLPKLFDNTVG